MGTTEDIFQAGLGKRGKIDRNIEQLSNRWCNTSGCGFKHLDRNPVRSTGFLGIESSDESFDLTRSTEQVI